MWSAVQARPVLLTRTVEVQIVRCGQLWDVFDDRICLWIEYERLEKDPWVWGLSYPVIRVIQVIWKGFWKKGLEQGLKRRKDLGHKMEKRTVNVGKSQESKSWEKNGKMVQESLVQAF